jgi:hemerythrin
MTQPAPTWRLVWSDELSVCIPEIDIEHRRFIELINALNEAIIERMSLAEIQRRMQDIMDDTVVHFAHEEALFRDWGYPLADEHAKKHKQAVQALNDIMIRFKRDRSDYDWIDAGLQVKQVLIEHLLNEDMKYRDFCCGLDDRSGCEYQSCMAREPGQPSS